MKKKWLDTKKIYKKIKFQILYKIVNYLNATVQIDIQDVADSLRLFYH